MDSPHASCLRRLQQQPQRAANRQQQQSSGSGEFQPRPRSPAGSREMPARPHAGERRGCP